LVGSTGNIEKKKGPKGEVLAGGIALKKKEKKILISSLGGKRDGKRISEKGKFETGPPAIACDLNKRAWKGWCLTLETTRGRKKAKGGKIQSTEGREVKFGVRGRDLGEGSQGGGETGGASRRKGQK